MNKTETIEYINQLDDEIKQIDAVIGVLADFARIGFLANGGGYYVQESTWFCIAAEHMIDYLNKEKRKMKESRNELIVLLWDREQ